MISVSTPAMSLGWTKNTGVPCAPMRVGPSTRLPMASNSARAELEAKGARILGPTRTGAHGTPVFFVHPKDMGGVLTEIMESPKQAH